MNPSNKFSSATKEIIGRAHEIALELGAENVSTVHFFLSDCMLNQKDSIKSFYFKNDNELNKFYNEQKLSEPRLLGDDKNGLMPLTNEATQTIRNCLKELKKYPQSEVQPYHLFLAASNHYSIFSSLLPPEENLYERLFDFYKQGGHISQKPLGQSFFKNKSFISIKQTRFMVSPT